MKRGAFRVRLRPWRAGLTLVVALGLLGSLCGAQEPRAAAQAAQPGDPLAQRLEALAHAAAEPPPGPDVSALVQSAAGQVTALQATVGGWGLSCEENSQLQLDLAYVRDALNQGNILGASELVEVTKAMADQDAQHGLLSSVDAAEFDTQSSGLDSAIPTQGSVPDEFHPPTRVPLPAASGCPGTLPGAAKSSAGALEVLSVGTGTVPDTNEILRMLLKFGVGQVPYAGKVLAGLVEILWPGEQKVTWKDLSAFVDARIGEAIDRAKRDALNGYLEGMQNVLHDYIRAAQTPQPWSDETKSTIKTNFVSALSSIELLEPQFRPRPDLFPHTYLLLPEYTQVENLLISQLRDGIVNGPSFGLDPKTNDYAKQIDDDIRKAGAYLDAQIPQAIAALPRPPDSPHYNVNLFNTQAALRDVLIPATKDQAYYWPYMNPAKYPVPPCPAPQKDCPSMIQVRPDDRLLEVPALGSIDNNGTPQPVQGGNITGFHIWGYRYINAIQMTYGAGPAGPKMGAGGGIDFPRGGGNFLAGNVSGSKGVITRVYGKSGDLPETIGLVFANGGKTYDTGTMGGIPSAGGNAYSFEFPGESLSSVSIPGTSRFSRTADIAVLGFRYADALPSPPGG